MQNGHGTYTEYATGDVYEGEWLNNERHGHGKSIAKHGEGNVTVYFFRIYRESNVMETHTVYLGEWKHDLKSGHGRLTGPGNAFVYNGEFKNDCMEGEGKWENNDDGIFYCVLMSVIPCCCVTCVIVFLNR